MLDWADTVEHLRRLGYDVTFAVPPDIREAWLQHGGTVRRLQVDRRQLADAGWVVS